MRQHCQGVRVHAKKSRLNEEKENTGIRFNIIRPHLAKDDEQQQEAAALLLQQQQKSYSNTEQQQQQLQQHFLCI